MFALGYFNNLIWKNKCDKKGLVLTALVLFLNSRLTNESS